MKQLLLVVAVGLAVPQLTGCFPVVVAGAGMGVLMAEDRRSSGTYVEDENIELKASAKVRENTKDDVHVSFTSYNRNVLVTGQVPGEDVKQRVAQLVKEIPNVRTVFNELTVAGNVSFAVRADDAYISTKVKTRFIDAQKFHANQVKVVTESGVVFLMGLVTQQEGDDAAQIASTTSGVQKVVKLFEYIPAPGSAPAPASAPAPIVGK